MERRTRSPRSAVTRLAVARAISVTGGAVAFTALMFAVDERSARSTIWLSAALIVTFGMHGVLGWFTGAAALVGTVVLLPLWRREAPPVPSFTSADELEAAPVGAEVSVSLSRSA